MISKILVLALLACARNLVVAQDTDRDNDNNVTTQNATDDRQWLNSSDITAYSYTATRNESVMVCLEDSKYSSLAARSGDLGTEFLVHFSRLGMNESDVMAYRESFFRWLDSMYGIRVPANANQTGVLATVYSNNSANDSQWMITPNVLSNNSDYRVILARVGGRNWAPGNNGVGARIYDASWILHALDDFTASGAQFQGQVHSGSVIAYGEYAIENLMRRPMGQQNRFTRLHYESPYPIVVRNSRYARSEQIMNADFSSEQLGMGIGLGTSAFYTRNYRLGSDDVFDGDDDDDDVNNTSTGDLNNDDDISADSVNDDDTDDDDNRDDGLSSTTMEAGQYVVRLVITLDSRVNRKRDRLAASLRYINSSVYNDTDDDGEAAGNTDNDSNDDSDDAYDMNDSEDNNSNVNIIDNGGDNDNDDNE